MSCLIVPLISQSYGLRPSNLVSDNHPLSSSLHIFGILLYFLANTHPASYLNQTSTCPASVMSFMVSFRMSPALETDISAALGSLLPAISVRRTNRFNFWSKPHRNKTNCHIAHFRRPTRKNLTICTSGIVIMVWMRR